MEPTRHTLPGGQAVQQLVPNTGTRQVHLTPERDVLCLHRGDEPYEDMFDGRPYRIEPGFFMTTYGAAQHFRSRSVVPGSRNPETSFQASFIVIIGIVELHANGSFDVLQAVDAPGEWTKFTEAEQAQYHDAVEALDRDAMVSPIDRDVIVAPVAGVSQGQRPGVAASRVRGGGTTSTRPGGSTKRGTARVAQAVEAPDEAAAAEFMHPIPAEDNPVVREAQAATRDAIAEGHRPGR